MKRPAFQFYPADWRNNANLRRCSPAARGVWMDILCVLHDSDEYGVCRWPLADLANAANAPIKLVRELIDKEVLKGRDKDATPYIYTPRHGGRDGDPVTLVEAKTGPCWYSSRFVRDEWVRLRRGSATHFTEENQPPKATPKLVPKPPIGEPQGDGPSSSSSSSKEKEKSPRKARNIPLPPDFAISERVREWAKRGGHTRLEPHFEALVSYAKRKGATYADWDEALMEAIRKDWGEVGTGVIDTYAGRIL